MCNITDLGWNLSFGASVQLLVTISDDNLEQFDIIPRINYSVLENNFTHRCIM